MDRPQLTWASSLTHVATRFALSDACLKRSFATWTQALSLIPRQLLFAETKTSSSPTEAQKTSLRSRLASAAAASCTCCPCSSSESDTASCTSASGNLMVPCTATCTAAARKRSGTAEQFPYSASCTSACRTAFCREGNSAKDSHALGRSLRNAGCYTPCGNRLCRSSCNVFGT